MNALSRYWWSTRAPGAERAPSDDERAFIRKNPGIIDAPGWQRFEAAFLTAIYPIPQDRFNRYCWVLDVLPGERKYAFVTERYPDCVVDFTQLELVLAKLPEDRRYEFAQLHARKIWNSDQLAAVLRHLPAEQRFALAEIDDRLERFVTELIKILTAEPLVSSTGQCFFSATTVVAQGTCDTVQYSRPAVG